MEEKVITIKLDTDAEVCIEKLEKIKKLLLDIKDLSKEVFKNETSDKEENIGLVFRAEKTNL